MHCIEEQAPPLAPTVPLGHSAVAAAAAVAVIHEAGKFKSLSEILKSFTFILIIN
jgi:hypothetical protein